jgi:putative ABC transport system substrate-binding protein
MRRRDFIAGAISATSISRARAQGRPPIVGLLASASPETFKTPLAGFLDGLKGAGFVEGGNVTIDYRWARGQFDRLPSLAEELVARPVDVLITIGGNVAALAARQATSRIPIVFLTGDDPVATGLVQSLSQPGANMTGVTWLAAELGTKNLELIHETLPAAGIIGVLFNPNRPTSEAQVRSTRKAVESFGKTLRVFNASTKEEIEAAFAAATSERIGALFITVDALFIFHRTSIIAAAAKQAIPTVYFQREFVELGGLISYGAKEYEASKICGDYVGRILKGARPADLPVQQSTKVELVINLKTAKALGLPLSPSLLARADEVIE